MKLWLKLEGNSGYLIGAFDKAKGGVL